MILTVTPNPAYDATYEVPEVRAGAVHRVTATHLRPGGKGVNVASVLAQLGEQVISTGFASPAFADEVRSAGLRAEFVTCLPHVRRTLAVVEPGRTTGFWEPGVPAPPGGVERLLDRVGSLLDGARCLVVSGSLPPGVPGTLAAQLAGLAVAADVPVVVDTSGVALREAARVRGVVLMPNHDELTELTGRCDSADGVVRRSRELLARGVRAVVATRGVDGLVVTDGTGSWAARPPYAVAGNPTGAGDAAAAAVARGLAHDRPLPEVAADTVAVSAAAVASPVAGRIDLDCHRELADRIETTMHVPGGIR